MDFSNLTDEQKEKARACESPEELIALAQEEGLDLTDEQLEAVAGGWGNSTCDDYVCTDYMPCNHYALALARWK